MLITQIRPHDQAVDDEAGAPETVRGLADAVILDFVGGLPGFPADRTFQLEMLAPEYGPFLLMRSVTHTEICFVLTVAGSFFPDYAVTIDEQHVANLGLESSEDAIVFAIVTLGDQATANLLGPVVVNRRTRAAAQVVQYESGYRASEPLVPLPEA